MTKKVHHLNSHYDIRAVFRKGRRVESPLFGAIFKRNGLARLRFTSVAPRSVDKRAVMRNRLRRRVREWVRTRSNMVGQPFDVIIIFKKDAAASPRKNFYEELERVFKKVREGAR